MLSKLYAGFLIDLCEYTHTSKKSRVAHVLNMVKRTYRPTSHVSLILRHKGSRPHGFFE